MRISRLRAKMFLPATVLIVVAAGCTAESDHAIDADAEAFRRCGHRRPCFDGGGGNQVPDGGPPSTTDSGAPPAIDGSVATDSSTRDGAVTSVEAGTDAAASTGAWPDATNTGVPAGTVLTAYTGPCTITAANTVIDAKTINCDLLVRAANVTISRSRINGSVATEESSTGYSFTITDSNVDIGNRPGTGVGAVNFTAVRVHVTGGNRSMHCWHDCTIRDSYVHGQFTDTSGQYHESGIRMGQNAIIQHNTIACDAPDVPPDAGCSAALTGYGDFGPVQNNLVENNFFKATTGGFCAYGGSSSGKPYSAATNHITFKGNVFERGSRKSDHGDYVCGYYGAVTAFDTNAAGNVWSGNTFDDGTPLAP